MSISKTDSSKNMSATDSLSNGVSEEESEILRFFDGRSVFLTGATGFLGTVILATLLTYCPGLKKVYVLLRSKKGLEPEERLNEILKKKIFHKLPESCPEYLTKIVVVPGDVSEENLGIPEQMTRELEENVSVVIHCAAVVNFRKPLGYMIKQIVIGTENVVKLCRRMKDLAVMTYISTALSFGNKFEVDETIPMMDVLPKDFMEAARLGDEDKLLELSKNCIPPWPNTYAFSKGVAENFLNQEVKDIPLAIIRPSGIFISWKGVLPGYVEDGFGLTDVIIAGAKGFIRVFHHDPNMRLDVIPVDTVVNTILSATNYVHKNKPKEALVVNCVSGSLNPVTIRDLSNSMLRLVKTYPIPNTYQKPKLIVTRNSVHYWLCAAVNHYTPALVTDLASILMGDKPKLTKMYMFLDYYLGILKPFLMNEWHFKCENYEMLIRSQSSKDKEIFPIDIREIDLDRLCENLRHGAPFYDWDTDKRGFDGRMAIIYKRYLITETIKWMTIITMPVLFGSLLWF